jgi:hypothetical protein
MTPIDGKLVNIVVPSKAPICPTWNVAAVAVETSDRNLTPTVPNSLGSSPTIVARATNCDDRRPKSRTTIA